ncbi:MAG: glycosyltransferase [Planctomycetota bacterium]|nr:glycosyltransferase [Planctomycetota bacterium]MDA1179692.1 glycosyltransferase [Planctomycetota bacterium]
MNSLPPRPIALITTELRPGGAEKCLVELAAGLRRTHWNPFVYCVTAPPPPDQNQLLDRLINARVPVQFLQLAHSWQLPRAIRDLRAAWRSEQIQLVQSFLFHANVIAARVSSQLQIPCIGGFRVREVKRSRRWILRALRHSFQHVTCVSQSIADQAQTEMGYSASGLTVISNSCETSDMPIDATPLRAKLSLRSDRRYLLFVGRLTEQKGIDRLLQFLPQILQGHPDVDLVILGSGPLKTALKRHTDATIYRERIHWRDWQTNVQEWMLATNILLLPSRWEGMPNVLLEAMAVGQTTVCMDVEGVREILGPLDKYQLVPRDDMLAFVASTNFWLTNPETARATGMANRVRVVDAFSPASMLTRYETLYQKLLA